MNIRNEFFRKQNPFEIAFILSLCCVALVMPFGRTITSIPLLLALLIRIVSGNYREWIRELKSNSRIRIHVLLYFIFVVGALFSDDHALAFFDLQVKLSLLLIPVILAASPPIPSVWKKTILYSLVFSCFVFSIIALLNAFIRSGDLGHNAFYYESLVGFTDIHPSYEGLFIAFSIAILVISLMQQWDNSPAFRKIIFVSLIIYFLFFLFLLSAKMSILSCFIFLNIALFIFIMKRSNAVKSSILLIAANAIAVYVLFSLPGTRDRFNFLFEYRDVTYTNSTESRTEIWKSSWQMFEDNWLIGVGTGDVKETLTGYYAANDFEAGVSQQYNAHNQYLQVLLATGIAGLTLFLLYFCNIIIDGARKRNNLYIAFICIFMINMLTESMLETQSGVVFFAFFNGILGVQLMEGKASG